MSLVKPPLQRNLASQRQHRREVIWQIVLPLALGVIAALGLVALTIGGQVETGRWAAISLIWLSLPLVLLAVLGFVVLVVAVFAVNWLLRNLPVYFFQALQFTLRIQDQLRRWDNRLVEPWLRVRAVGAGWSRAMRWMKGKHHE